MTKLPQKRHFRQRAHANPFSDHHLDYPSRPEDMNWSTYYPKMMDGDISFADIGCGYGGLLISLGPLFPNTKMIGMEIRIKVCEYVKQRIEALRLQHASDSYGYDNVAVVRTNAMKTMPHFFKRQQLSKMFFLFPDPHFKRKKHKARIISPTLLSDYAFYLKNDGLLYLATDVKELFDYMVACCVAHPLFEQVPETDYKDDPVVHHVLYSTEEGKKVARNQGDKFIALFKRLPNPPLAL